MSDLTDPVMADFPPPPGDWRWVGACAEEDPDTFFESNQHHQVRAFAVCSFCPVQTQCLEYAITNRIDDGVWGGTNRQDRRAVKWDLSRAAKRAERRMNGDLSDETVRAKLQVEKESI